jgi:uncharacterized membrane protein YcaP (DUF421 family)
LQGQLRENRISINELLSELRAQGIGDIESVHYAVLEQTGSLSLLTKDNGELAHPIIIDGEIIYDTLGQVGYSEEWLTKELKKRQLSAKDVFLMTVNDHGKVNAIRKERNR